ncbi:hypothetical protein [Streptacidiphilus melanogenes]|uniref:hypothetical protein n=1 Tax=Streptacidiphilus melanogenes TaxID=411235 RepID=UPI0005AA566A|nr:hypothetical protein [Streptacidiphilus melanogenes]
MSPTRRTVLGGAAAIGAAAALTGLNARNASADGTSGSVTQAQARNNMIAVDTAMQSNYDALRANVINQLAPVIVVNNDLVGGTYYLINKGTVVEQIQPVDPVFALAKSIAHTPLGIYSICAPSLDPGRILPAQKQYIDPHDLRMVAFNGPGNTSWTTPLQTFATTLQNARQTLEAANLPQDANGSLHDSCAYILDKAQDYISETIRSREFDMAKFEAFTADVYPSVRTNMYWSSRVQIDGVSQLMTRWRNQIGSAWSGLYVVVLSIWTTYEQNQNSIILQNFMDQSQVSTHLVNLMTAQTPTDPVHVALDNLARIVQDNIAAEMVFSTDQPTADALKGQPDLLSTEILKLLGGTTATGSGAKAASALTKGQLTQIACPFHNRSAALKA